MLKFNEFTIIIDFIMGKIRRVYAQYAIAIRMSVKKKMWGDTNSICARRGIGAYIRNKKTQFPNSL